MAQSKEKRLAPLLPIIQRGIDDPNGNAEMIAASRVAGAVTGRVLDAPMPGHFAIRLGRRHPWTPALIFLPCPFLEPEPYALDTAPPKDWCTPLDRAPNPLRAKIANCEIENPEMVIKIWQGGRTISAAEYSYLSARREWARRYAPESYHAQPIDLSVLRNREIL